MSSMRCSANVGDCTEWEATWHSYRDEGVLSCVSRRTLMVESSSVEHTREQNVDIGAAVEVRLLAGLICG